MKRTVRDGFLETFELGEGGIYSLKGAHLGNLEYVKTQIQSPGSWQL